MGIPANWASMKPLNSYMGPTLPKSQLLTEITAMCGSPLIRAQGVAILLQNEQAVRDRWQRITSRNPKQKSVWFRCPLEAPFDHRVSWLDETLNDQRRSISAQKRQNILDTVRDSVDIVKGKAGLIKNQTGSKSNQNFTAINM